MLFQSADLMPKPTNENSTEGPLKKVTIRDVAKQAGVSFKTVSRVFNNETTVRPMTREKVLSAAEALNFSPNIFARQLSLGRSNTIGLVIFDFPRWSYYADVIMGVQRECQKHGFSVSVYSLTSASKEQLVTLRLAVLSRSLAGLVLTAPWSSNKRFLAQVDSWDISIACILSDNEDSIHPAVFNNDIEGARVRARHLLSLGHRRFAIAAGDLHRPFVRARLQGTLEELNKAGIKSSDIAILYGDVSFEAGYELGTEIINQPNKPTAILAANDLMAVGIMLLPATAGRFWTNGISSLIIVAVTFAMLSSFIGLLISFHYSLPSGPAIILVNSIVYGMSLMFGPVGGIVNQVFFNRQVKV